MEKDQATEEEKRNESVRLKDDIIQLFQGKDFNISMSTIMYVFANLMAIGIYNRTMEPEDTEILLKQVAERTMLIYNKEIEKETQ